MQLELYYIAIAGYLYCMYCIVFYCTVLYCNCICNCYCN